MNDDIAQFVIPKLVEYTNRLSDTSGYYPLSAHIIESDSSVGAKYLYIDNDTSINDTTTPFVLIYDATNYAQKKYNYIHCTSSWHNELTVMDDSCPWPIKQGKVVYIGNHTCSH